jgi:hypothetical protein
MTNESEDILYEMAEQAWNECWPEEPVYVRLSLFGPSERASKRTWLLEVFTNLVDEYDGPLSNIANHLGDFSDKWIEKRAQAILEDAREAEASAREDWMEDR